MAKLSPSAVTPKIQSDILRSNTKTKFKTKQEPRRRNHVLIGDRDYTGLSESARSMGKTAEDVRLDLMSKNQIRDQDRARLRRFHVFAEKYVPDSWKKACDKTITEKGENFGRACLGAHYAIRDLLLEKRKWGKEKEQLEERKKELEAENKKLCGIVRSNSMLRKLADDNKRLREVEKENKTLREKVKERDVEMARLYEITRAEGRAIGENKRLRTELRELEVMEEMRLEAEERRTAVMDQDYLDMRMRMMRI